MIILVCLLYIPLLPVVDLRAQAMNTLSNSVRKVSLLHPLNEVVEDSVSVEVHLEKTSNGTTPLSEGVSRSRERSFTLP